MATSRRGIRSTRKLRQWIVEQVESGKFPGLVWDDPLNKTMIRIPWKHAGKQEFRQDEDAGFFKAWAIFKGKYHPGERCDPASWKTRIRCALAKSSEFEEVPQCSKLGTAEPYKVYRLVPVPEQCVGKQSKAQKLRNPKKESSSESSESENGGSCDSLLQLPDPLGSHTLELNSDQETVTILPPSPLFSPAYQNGDSSPLMDDLVAKVLSDVNEIAIQTIPGPEQVTPAAESETEKFSVKLSIFYSGELVKTIWISEGDFLITSIATPPRILANSMFRVVLPSPLQMDDPRKRETTQQFLQEFERGMMAASNVEGIFVQYRGKASVFWRGGNISQPQGRLQSNTHTRLFNTREFKAALQNYHQGLGPQPEHRVTLCVGEELGENDNIDSKHIIIQMEQKFTLSLTDQHAVQIPVSSTFS